MKTELTITVNYEDVGICLEKVNLLKEALMEANQLADSLGGKVVNLGQGNCQGNHQ